MQQLALGLQIRDDATFDNFFIGQNEWVCRALRAWLASEGESFIYLWGHAGSGRSHLLQACCHAANIKQETVAYLPMRAIIEMSPAILSELEYQTFICIDDIDMACQQPDWEEALFHFYNRIQTAQTRLLVTASTAPSQSTFVLPDLRSRLAWGIALHVQALNDDDKLRALQMRAKARGVMLMDDVGHFLLRRCSRDMTTLLAILDTLDAASLSAQRRLTVPFVKTVLAL